MEHDYDEYYDTKVSRPYSRSAIGLFAGGFIFFIGICDIVITIVDMYVSQYNLGQSQTNSDSVYTWDENPFWPSYGKGFWVGLILLVTGIVGIVSYCENTLTSIYAFIALCTTGAIFSIYQLVTASIPLAKYNEIGSSATINNIHGNYFLNSLALNAVLLALGGLGFLTCLAAALLSSLVAGCCSERRGYGGQFIENFYKSVPANTPIPANSAGQGSYISATNPAFVNY